MKLSDVLASLNGPVPDAYRRTAWIVKEARVKCDEACAEVDRIEGAGAGALRQAFSRLLRPHSVSWDGHTGILAINHVDWVMYPMLRGEAFVAFDRHGAAMRVGVRVAFDFEVRREEDLHRRAAQVRAMLDAALAAAEAAHDA